MSAPLTSRRDAPVINKTRRAQTRIRGPRFGIDVEVNRRAWQDASSSSGVAIQVSRIRARAGGADAMTSPAMLSVYSGRTVLGFIISRGRAGFDAYAADEKLIGTYPTQKAAADAIALREASTCS
jgi:hypothetical protein